MSNNYQQPTVTMEDVSSTSPVVPMVEDEKMSSVGTRRSERVRKKPERFDFTKYPPRKQRKKRKREVSVDMEDFESPFQKPKKVEKSNKTKAQDVANTFTELFLSSIDTMNASQTRLDALRRSIRKASEMVLTGMVTATSNGDHLVTSSDRSQTYVVKSTPLAEKIHHTCNCGQRFGVGERVTCKHILAVIMSSLDSVIRMFFQISTRQSVEAVDEICKLAEKIGITDDDNKSGSQRKWTEPSHKVLEKPFQMPQDYFSMILRPGNH